MTTPLLQNLLDNELDKHSDTSKDESQHAKEYYENIRENLEFILNTHSYYFSNQAQGNLQRSLVNFGINDITHSFFATERGHNDLCQIVQQAISRFEPRLSQVEVSVITGEWENDRRLKLRIEAAIHTPQGLDAAIFETHVDFSKQQFRFEQ